MEPSSFEEMIREENRHLDEQKKRARQGELEKVKAEAEAHADVQVETADMLRHMDEILAITSKHLEADDLFSQILGRLREIMEVDSASILLLDDHEKSLYFRASDGLEEAVVRGIRIEVGTDHSGRVAWSGHPQRWSDMDPDKMANPVMIERGMRSMAGVPIKGDHGVLGVLEVGQVGNRAFEDTEMRMLQISAHHVGLALERAQLLSHLRTARLRAQEANRFKTTLMQMLTHDLKTPLTAVMMQLQLIARPDLPEAKRVDLVDRVQGNLSMLQLMMDDFLDMTRIEADRFTFHPTEVDVGELVQQVVDLYSAQAEGGHVKLHFDKQSVHAKLDARRLRQVLANLVSNAIRYNEPGGKVTITLEPLAKDLRIHIRDTGRGMTPEQLRMAALPFSQVHDSQREQEGSGLGLHLSRMVLEEQGGSLRLKSGGPGLGTTAIATLPVGSSRAPGQHPP